MPPLEVVEHIVARDGRFGRRRGNCVNIIVV
jgi:hypothetical protein